MLWVLIRIASSPNFICLQLPTFLPPTQLFLFFLLFQNFFFFAVLSKTL